jgi:hypothetical protein
MASGHLPSPGLRWFAEALPISAIHPLERPAVDAMIFAVGRLNVAIIVP